MFKVVLVSFIGLIGIVLAAVSPVLLIIYYFFRVILWILGDRGEAIPVKADKKKKSEFVPISFYSDSENETIKNNIKLYGN